jgi:hypothetical protein
MSLSSCPKCGEQNIYIRYKGKDIGQHHLYQDSNVYRSLLCVRQDEHLHKICRECGYEWVEDCLSQPTITITPQIQGFYYYPCLNCPYRQKDDFTISWGSFNTFSDATCKACLQNRQKLEGSNG